MADKIQVGQKVWVLGIGNNARNGSELKEVIVSSVGKKYFTLTDGWYGRFLIETLYQDGKGYMSGYMVYLDKQQREAEIEHFRLSDKIQKAFGGYGKLKYPIETLRKILELIETPTPLKGDKH